MQRRRVLVCLFVALGGAACSNKVVEFRPAKDAKAYGPVADAWRVREAPPDCDRLGVLHVEGATDISDLASAAAEHGGTHYVVRGDRSEVIAYSGLVYGGAGTLQVEKDRKIWAEVYHCGKGQ